jgi:hypothetical protein
MILMPTARVLRELGSLAQDAKCVGAINGSNNKVESYVCQRTHLWSMDSRIRSAGAREQEHPWPYVCIDDRYMRKLLEGAAFVSIACSLLQTNHDARLLSMSKRLKDRWSLMGVDMA